MKQHDEMLGLAVHSLPDPAQISTPAPSLASSRLKLLAIVLLCTMPVILTWLALNVVPPQGQAALGELINPVRPMPAVQATRMDASTVPLASLRAQWLLVKVDGAECASECQKQLLLLRQLWLMLGKDLDRVDWVWLIDDQKPVDAALQSNLAKDHATVLRLDPASMQSWFDVPQGKTLKDYFFVVDPMGNTMMRIPVQLDSGSARKAKLDLERLLRASAPWDPAGR